ncbi:hypothetical protein V491_05162 [Pseudogymnoascus sp. VKM F-3775]|nr:hypothetical protein V491_05162 [Pseudogymnoascus sp. VKM F-3775]
MSEHATSVEAVSAPVDSSVAHPDNATAEGDSSSAVATTGDSNGVSAESKEELPVAEAAKEDSEVKVLPEDENPAETATENGTNDVADTVAEATATPSSANKSKARRKSSGVPEHKGRKLNKKESKAKMSNIHAQPGEYYFIKLRGFPKWPGIIASEDMLPDAILKSRPVTAAKPDGTYREDFAEGGKNALDRTFPVMFLETNEFAWVPNTDLEPLDTSVIGSIPQGKLSKSLYAAYQLAAENHDLDHFKNVLREFEATRRDEKAAQEAAKAAKASAKKGKKAKDVVQDEDEDVEMADVGEVEKEDKPKVSKKRKAVADDDEISTPKRTDSVKKPKLKLINSAQKGNAAETPKSAAKEKKEKAKPKTKKAPAVPTPPKEPELSAEEKSKKKEKEVRFLRHKLQKGFLDNSRKPIEEEMKQMSEFITKLEGYADLEVSIIRATKINKVLKGILKLEEIPKDAEFKFRERSTDLLTKWNKILESETPAPTSAQTNGTSKEQVNGDSAKAEDATTTTGLDGADDTLAPEVEMEDADAKDEQKKPGDEEKPQEEKPQEEEKPEEEEKAADDKTEVTVAEATPVEATA